MDRPAHGVAAGPVAGVRALGPTRVLSGPFATALLGDLGAEVVKVEAPQGDDFRHVGPFRDGESALYQLVNRNQRGMVLDRRDPADRARARALATPALGADPAKLLARWRGPPRPAPAVAATRRVDGN
jgi:CoA:oxalate CoA-transferase